MQKCVRVRARLYNNTTSHSHTIQQQKILIKLSYVKTCYGSNGTYLYVKTCSDDRSFQSIFGFCRLNRSIYLQLQPTNHDMFVLEKNKKSLTNTKGNMWQRCTHEGRVRMKSKLTMMFHLDSTGMMPSAISSAWISISAQNRKFFLPSSHLAPLFWCDPFRIYGKALWFLKLEFSRQLSVKIWWF